MYRSESRRIGAHVDARLYLITCFGGVQLAVWSNTGFTAPYLGDGPCLQHQPIACSPPTHWPRAEHYNCYSACRALIFSTPVIRVSSFARLVLGDVRPHVPKGGWTLVPRPLEWRGSRCVGLGCERWNNHNSRYGVVSSGNAVQRLGG